MVTAINLKLAEWQVYCVSWNSSSHSHRNSMESSIAKNNCGRESRGVRDAPVECKALGQLLRAGVPCGWST